MKLYSYKILIGLFLFILLLSCRTQNQEPQFNFKEYYTNSFNAKNNKIWHSDSLYYSNNISTSEFHYNSLINDKSLSTTEKQYCINQLLFLYDELRHQIKFDSIYSHYNLDKNAFNDTILKLQSYLLDNIYNSKTDFSPTKYSNQIKELYSENHHLYIKTLLFYLDYYSTKKYDSSKTQTICAQLKYLMENYSNKSKDLHSYYKLQFHNNFNLINNENSYYYAKSLLDKNNYSFPLNSFNQLEGSFLLGKILLFIKDKAHGITQLNKSLEIINSTNNYIYKYVSLDIITQIAIINERLKLNMKTINNSYIGTPSLLDSLYNIKVEFHKSLSNGFSDDLKKSSVNTLKYLPLLRYSHHKEYFTPRYYLSLIERKEKNYSLSNQLMFNAYLLKHSLESREYSFESVVNSNIISKEEHSFILINEFIINHYFAYKNNSSRPDLDIALRYINLIEEIIDQEIDCKYEINCIELNINRKQLYNNILNIMYEYYILGEKTIEEFTNYSDVSKADLLRVQKETYNTKSGYLFGKLDLKLIENFHYNEDYKKRFDLINEKINLYNEIDFKTSSTNNKSIKDVLASLQDDQKILVFNQLDSVLYIQSLTKKEKRVYKVIYKEEHIKKYITYVSTNDPKFYEDTITQNIVYKTLVEPWFEIDDNYNTLTIVPDLNLTNFPFEAILFPYNKELTYLLDKYHIEYSNSIKSINENGCNNFNHNSISAFSFNSKDDFYKKKVAWINLPGAYKEVTNIKHLYSNSEIYYGKNCTRDNILKSLRKDDVIHIASHGRSNDNNIYDNYINFRINDRESDKLYGFEFISEKSTAKLVILSGCETSSGTLTNGEGLYSVIRFMLLSGVENIIASKWKLNDRASEVLFNEFYKSNINNCISNSARLTKAKRLIRFNEYLNHPYNWAGIQLYVG